MKSCGGDDERHSPKVTRGVVPGFGSHQQKEGRDKERDGERQGYGGKGGSKRGRLKGNREGETKREELGQRKRATVKEEVICQSPHSHGGLRTEFHSKEDTEPGSGLS